MSELSYFTTGDGCRLAYRLDGPDAAPMLVLSNSIATTMRMWDGQIPELSQDYRVLRYDLRGHGASAAPSGPYSLDRLGRDVIELLDALEVETFTFCGLSFGGFIGQWLGVRAADRIDRLILANTSPFLGPPDLWDQQIDAVLAATDMSAISEFFLTNWLPPRLLARDDVVAPIREDLLAMSRQGLAGCYAAIRDADARPTNQLISSPTLVIVGDHDPVCLPEHGKAIAEAIPNAQLVTLPTQHLSNVEMPEEFLAAVFTFLDASSHRAVGAACSGR